MMMIFRGDVFSGSSDVNCTNSCFTLKVFTFLAFPSLMKAFKSGAFN